MSHGPAQWTDHDTYRERRAYTVLRAARLAEARKLGTHLPIEWLILSGMIRCCVVCGATGFPLTKDHIVEIADGGCDCIANIQPVCLPCNSRRPRADLRPAVVPDWSARLANIMGRIFA